jgi:hypothetical protein
MPFNKLVQQPENDYIERGDMVARANEAFAAVVPGYADTKERISADLNLLTDRIAEMEKAGQDITVADQMAREIGWFRKYTADWAAAEQRIDRLKDLLAGSISIPNAQDDDGSFGPGCTIPYRMLEPTVDELQIKDLTDPSLKPLKFMARYQNPKWLLSELYRLQITDIKTNKVNYRDELGSLQSSLSQLMFKDGLRETLNNNPRLGFQISQDMLDVYSDFLEQTQHPRTGYWGPWYRFDDELIRVQDLSFTFHIISYRGGDVARWPLIVDTTLDIENLEFPGGWYTNKKKSIKFSHHHNFDVATILAYGWPHIDTKRKGYVKTAIQKMLIWCVTEAIEKDGGFKSEGGLLANTYYFGVRFLDKVGYWDPMKRFWGRDLPKFKDCPSPAGLAKRLKDLFAKLNDPSSEGETTRTILRMAAASEESGEST